MHHTKLSIFDQRPKISFYLLFPHPDYNKREPNIDWETKSISYQEVGLCCLWWLLTQVLIQSSCLVMGGMTN